MSVKTITRLLISAAMLVATACTKDTKKENLNPLLKDSNEIISTRPQNSTQLIAILKLKNNWKQFGL